MKRSHLTLTALIVGALILSINTRTHAVDSLGTGTGALLGSDLTDPENDGSDTANSNGVTSQGANFNWKQIQASSEEYFGDPAGGLNEGSFDVFDNKVGAGDAKWCCIGPPQFVAVEFWHSVILTHFTIASGNDSVGRDPDQWKIQGSNDSTDGSNGTWTDIFTYAADGTSPFAARNEVLLYSTGALGAPGDADYSVPTGYHWIRYQVTSVVSGTTHQINELEFFSTVPEPATLTLGLFGVIGLLARRRRPA